MADETSRNRQEEESTIDESTDSYDVKLDSKSDSDSEHITDSQNSKDELLQLQEQVKK